MVPNKKQEREAHEARTRVRAFQARRSVHEHQVKRRARDNLIAGVSVAAVVALAVGAQILFFNGGPGTSEPSAASVTPSASAAPADTENSGEVPPIDLAEDRTWTGTLALNGIPLEIELDGALAPQAVSSTVSLINTGFYQDLTCHRLTDGGFFVLQCGDPTGTGSGGPGYSYGPIENAPSDDVYPAGTLAMARQGGNASSMGSQFFIVYDDTTIPSDAVGGYTILGRVTGGLDEIKAQITDAGVADGSSDGAPKVPTSITQVSVQKN